MNAINAVEALSPSVTDRQKSPSRSRSVTSWGVLAVALAALAMPYGKPHIAPGYTPGIAGAPILVEQTIAKVKAIPAAPGQSAIDLQPEVRREDDGTERHWVRVAEAGDYRLEMIDKAGTVTSTHNFSIQSPSRLVLAVVLLSILALFLPWALSGRERGTAVYGAWYHLLSEPQGGYSLSRLQLLIWFLPAAILYGGLSLTLQTFGEINSQLALLLGLSGATSLLGTASSPPQSGDGPLVAPDLSDLVSDWQSNGDVSRYQYLLLSIFGALVMVTAFFHDLRLPTIPTHLLYLVAGSQATYVATKAIKSAKAGDGSAPADS